MSSVRVASVDIGTNTILMMIADYFSETGDIIIQGDYHAIARLGENLNKTGLINDEAVLRANNVLEDYHKICREMNVQKVFPVATSAMRDAKNSEEVKVKLSDAIKSEIEVISGEQEASCSFFGTIEDESPSIVIDIGGGSTEIIKRANNRIEYRKSVNIGAVRLTEMFFSKHPPYPAEIDSAVAFIDELIKEYLLVPSASKIYAVAGTPTSLAAVLLNLKTYDSRKVNGYELKLDDIDALISKFADMKLEDIISVFNIHPKRADVITMGSLILSRILRYLGADKCTVSANGLRLGVIKWKTSYMQ